MIGDGIDSIAPLTQERQELENPCCNCKESGVSMTCRCDDRKKYDIERQRIQKYDNMEFVKTYAKARSLSDKFLCIIAKLLHAKAVTPLGRILLLPKEYENMAIATGNIDMLS